MRSGEGRSGESGIVGRGSGDTKAEAGELGGRGAGGTTTHPIPKAALRQGREEREGKSMRRVVNSAFPAPSSAFM